MKILAENIESITLSQDEVSFFLILNEEYKYFLEEGIFKNNSFFLYFKNVFGSTHCPNYDIFLQDENFLTHPVDLGVLSCFGAKPKSADNSEGLAQSVRLDDSDASMIGQMLLASSRIRILLVSQGGAAPERQVTVEFSCLCYE